MIDIGVVNLKESGNQGQIFSNSKISKMTQALALELERAGIDYSAIKSTVPEDYSPYKWAVPPLVTGTISNVIFSISPIGVSLPADLVEKEKLIRVFTNLTSQVRKDGYYFQVIDLVPLIGDMAYDERVFNLTNHIKDQDKRVLIFALNLATAFSASHTVVFRENSFYAEIDGLMFGVVSGKVHIAVEVPTRPVENLNDILYQDRGTLVAYTCKLDVVANILSRSSACDTTKKRLLKGLATLKYGAGTQINSGEKLCSTLYELSTLAQRQAQTERLLKLYTYDNLELVRDVWLDYSKPIRERLKNLYEYLVPKYIDEENWKSIFKVSPFKAKFHMRDSQMEFKINEAMERFIMYFINTKNNLEKDNAKKLRANSDSLHR